MPAALRKLLVLAAGSLLLLVGVAMLVLPGPAILVIPAALALLATEFGFARRWLAVARRHVSAYGMRQRARSADTYRERIR